LLVLIDESLPKRLRRELPGLRAFTVQQQGWSRTKNGALLRVAEAAGFDAFLTADQSLQYQQNLSTSQIRIIVFAALSNRLEHIRPLLPAALLALGEMKAGEVRVIKSGA
jgi:alkanesulfonate monooxygenase SsuD/methylene tetrahydromethanopterin reductase-like flavin-dependent oxidoreductase (luciferase family)